MAPSTDREECYVLRVRDQEAAQKVRSLLRQKDVSRLAGEADLEVKFEVATPRQGTFRLGSETYHVELQDLPTIVELYKTYDDVNLVKCMDIGQVLLVHEKGSQPTKAAQSKDGITPPFHNARQRFFRKLPEAPAGKVRATEAAIISIAEGHAPPGVEYIDVEEEYVVDEQGRGSWQQIPSTKP